MITIEYPYAGDHCGLIVWQFMGYAIRFLHVPDEAHLDGVAIGCGYDKDGQPTWWEYDVDIPLSARVQDF